jgi:D-sedoheptulose 7-phosphate isomerase
VADEKGLSTFAILGFDGGKAKDMVKTSIHAPVNDMQVSEDIQMIIAHIISQWMFDQLSDQTI